MALPNETKGLLISYESLYDESLKVTRNTALRYFGTTKVFALKKAKKMKIEHSIPFPPKNNYALP